jgi:hypothetical protein
MKPASDATGPTSPIIHHDARYIAEQLQTGLGLKRSTMAREYRLPRQRHAKRAGRLYIIGSWALE